MVIGTIFKFMNEVIEVRINENQCLFKTTQLGGRYVTIDNLRLICI